MPKWVKFIIAVLLLPFCLGAAEALWQIVRASGRADTVWIPMLAGAACWVVVYLLLPRPMWLYVVGHEVTHAVWTWLFLGKVKSIKASSQGGHVVVSKQNFLIVLAPYFFPLYAILVLVVFAIGHLIWGWAAYRAWFHLLLGAAYAFHLTLTGHILQSHQSDITSQGYLFSAVVIFLGNILVLLVGIPILANLGVLQGLGLWLKATGAVVLRLRGFI